jgi:heme/copper-type cytochrome/quinol oxidase subunit 4
LYGGSRVSYEIAEDDELPHELTSQLWNQPIGLLITAVVTIVVTNTMELESISTAGSVGFLLIFGIVNFVAYKLADVINGNKIISMSGFVLCLIALVVLLFQQVESNLTSVIVAISIIAFCFIGEWMYKTFFKKKI